MRAVFSLFFPTVTRENTAKDPSCNLANEGSSAKVNRLIVDPFSSTNPKTVAFSSFLIAETQAKTSQ